MKSVISGGKMYEGCENCLHFVLHGGEGAAKHAREFQKKQYRGELVQPNQHRDFIKAYGIEKAREYYNEETIRKYG
jgi:hypothetical protein